METKTKITYQALQQREYLAELSKIFDSEEKVRNLLEAANIPLERVKPPFSGLSVLEYWKALCREIDKGLISDGLLNLVSAALSQYPGNIKLRELLVSAPDSQNSNRFHDLGMSKQYDVFLAHNSRDGDNVEIIAMALKRRNLNPWLDRWNLPPGVRFAVEIEKILPQTKSIAVLIGSSGIGPWEDMEHYAALTLFVKQQRPIIPVILPNLVTKPELPLFLSQFGWVSFKSLDDQDALDNLQWAITGQRPNCMDVNKNG